MFINYQNMLHSRLASPKLDHNPLSVASSSVVRSKSTLNFTNVIPKTQDALQKIGSKQAKTISRVQSAIKKQEQMSLSTLPKVSSNKGKLFLGKLVKPGVILSTEARKNPWAEPSSINQMLISKKGLMEMINMGMLPKNTNFTQLLNHRYEQTKSNSQQVQQQQNDQDNNFFPTNPNIAQENLPLSHKPEIKQQKKQVTLESSDGVGDKKFRKKVKKGLKSKKQIVFDFPQEPVVLVISNQQIEKSEHYEQQVKKVRKTGQEIVFKQYIKRVQQFAVKYGLKKFQFRVLLDETRKMSDTVIKQQILNAKALGIYMAMKGNVSKRIRQITLMFATRFKFKKSVRDLLKIENIKRYFKIKKYYEEMTKKRCDLLRFKLSSFAERQRRFVQEASDKFSVHIHMLSTVAENFDKQLSYYKIEHRNNIELTRLFSQQPQHLILLMEQQECSLSSWLALLAKVKGYHPTIEPIFSSLRNSNVKTYDSIYYGLNPKIMQKLAKITRSRDDICIYPSGFCSSLVKICESLNAKLYSSSFWKPHLIKLLEEDNESQDIAYQSLKYEENPIHKRQASEGINLSSRSSPQTVSIELIKSRVNFSGNQLKAHSKAQIKHFIQKAKSRQLNSYELNSQHYSNKLAMKNQILLANDCTTPYSLSFSPGTEEKILLQKFTEVVLSLKTVNRWVFKIATSARFSRSLAFLETDSLKILKQKKKKSELTQTDIAEVTNIMKVILIDKLQIPQNSLFDSKEYLETFLQSGGYVESVIEEVSSECVFGKISVAGNFEILGTYTKIYTDQIVGCAATYPSHNIKGKHFLQVRQLAEKMFKNHQILGHVTFQLLIEKKTQKCHFVDLILNLQQYSSLYFMYTSLFNNLNHGESSLNILRKINKKKITINSPKVESKSLEKSEEYGILNESQSKLTEDEKDKTKLIRQIVYVPFVDNNGNIYENFEQFEDACSLKGLKLLDFEEVEGLQFLYLNLREQKPDILSLVAFSESEKKCLKYALEGLTFLTESGEQANKFDKKVERRKYDCLYIHDVIWRLRQVKKSKDSIVQVS